MTLLYLNQAEDKIPQFINPEFNQHQHQQTEELNLVFGLSIAKSFYWAGEKCPQIFVCYFCHNKHMLIIVAIFFLAIALSLPQYGFCKL